MEENKEIKLPIEVFLNVQEGDEKFVLSTQSEGEKSVQYVRSDIVNNIIEEAKSTAKKELNRSVNICSKTIDVLSIGSRVREGKAYLVAIAMLFAFMFLHGISLLLTVIIIILVNVLLTMVIGNNENKQFEAIVAGENEKKEETDETNGTTTE